MTVLVIDVGSSSVRALLVDPDLNVVGESLSRCEYAFSTDSDGTSVADAAEIRLLVEAAIDDVLQHPKANQITAVGMDTFVGNLVGVDESNSPVTPLFTYADTRSAEDVNLLREKIDLSTAHQRTGCPHHTAYHPARLHWLKHTQPETFAKVAQWLDLSTYFYRQWFGKDVPQGYSTASWSGLLNRNSLTWDQTWLDTLGVEISRFPELADMDNVQTGLRNDYAKRWDQLQKVPFYLALGDGAAANIGSGGVNRQRVVLTVGTTAALRIVTDETLPTVPDGLWGYRVDKAHHLVGGATSEGGSIFEWARKTLALNTLELEKELAQREPAAHNLTFLPLLAGERSPGYAIKASGTLHGLRLSTTPMDILQAGLEGVSLRLAIIADMLSDDDSAIYAGGGAMQQSPAWAQIMANAFNRPVHLLDEPEVTARGVVAVITNQLDKAANVSISETLQPNAAHVDALKEARARQQKLYEHFY